MFMLKHKRFLINLVVNVVVLFIYVSTFEEESSHFNSMGNDGSPITIPTNNLTYWELLWSNFPKVTIYILLLRFFIFQFKIRIQKA